MNPKIKALIIIIIGAIIGSVIFYYIHYIFTIEKPLVIHPASYMLILYIGLGFPIGFFSTHIMKIKNRKNTAMFSFVAGLFLVISMILIELYFEFQDMLKAPSGNIFMLIAGGFGFFLVYSPVIISSILGGLTNYYIRKKRISD